MKRILLIAATATASAMTLCTPAHAGLVGGGSLGGGLSAGLGAQGRLDGTVPRPDTGRIQAKGGELQDKAGSASSTVRDGAAAQAARGRDAAKDMAAARPDASAAAQTQAGASPRGASLGAQGAAQR